MPAFPTPYLEEALDEALTRYRVDPDRVTLSGLSMGGEAAYRLARHRPATFAGVSVLAGFDAMAFPDAKAVGLRADLRSRLGPRRNPRAGDPRPR